MRISKHKLFMAVLDAGVVSAGFSLAFWTIFKSGLYGAARHYPLYFAPSVIILVVIFISAYQLEGLYKDQALINPFHQIQKLLRCYIRVLAAFIVFVFFMKTQYIADSRMTIGLGFVFSFLISIAMRAYFIPYAFRLVVKKGIIRKRAVIIGAGENGRAVLKHWTGNPQSYFQIVGFLDDNRDLAGTTIDGIDVLGTSADISRVASGYHLDNAVIAISHIEREAVLELIDKCREAGLDVYVISALFSKVNEKLEAEQLGGLTTFRLESKEIGIVRAVAKRVFDLAVSSVLLILLAPVFGVLAWAIKRNSRGSVFYRTAVVGKNEIIFCAYKFRTMIAANPADEAENKIYEEGRRKQLEFMRDFIQGKLEDEYFVKDETRMTKVGRFLRKYSIDELPQLINVFRGEMSLVGPRFCSVSELGFYKPWHKRRFRVKPGITGLWQVRARSEVTYDDMIMMDLYYIQNWSFSFDLEILFRTIPVVLRGKGSRIA